MTVPCLYAAHDVLVETVPIAGWQGVPESTGRRRGRRQHLGVYVGRLRRERCRYIRIPLPSELETGPSHVCIRKKRVASRIVSLSLMMLLVRLLWSGELGRESV